MADVIMAQKKPGLTSQILPLAGQVVGGMVGGPAGASLGGMAGSKLAEQKAPVAPVQSTAMQRRIDTIAPQQDTMADLAAADQAVASLPKPLQQQYGPAIRRARMLEEQQGRIA